MWLATRKCPIAGNRLGAVRIPRRGFLNRHQEAEFKRCSTCCLSQFHASSCVVATPTCSMSPFGHRRRCSISRRFKSEVMPQYTTFPSTLKRYLYVALGTMTRCSAIDRSYLTKEQPVGARHASPATRLYAPADRYPYRHKDSRRLSRTRTKSASGASTRTYGPCRSISPRSSRGSE